MNQSVELWPRINRKKVIDLIRYKNWRFPYSHIARKTGYSRSYVRRVLIGRENLTSSFMGELIRLSGLDPTDPNEWGQLFNWSARRKPPNGHPRWNDDKLNSRMPYAPLSPHYTFRKQDQPDLEILPRSLRWEQRTS